MSAHHIVPISRDRKSEEVVHLPTKFHQAYHTLFSNLLPDEAEEFLFILHEMMKENPSLNGGDISSLRAYAQRRS